MTFASGHSQRKYTKRFIFEYEYYDSDCITNQRMLHVKIYGAGKCPLQTDLWLDERDQEKLKEILNE